MKFVLTAEQSLSRGYSCQLATINSWTRLLPATRNVDFEFFEFFHSRFAKWIVLAHFMIYVFLPEFSLSNQREMHRNILSNTTW